MKIINITNNNVDLIQPLAIEAKEEGFNFVQRAIDEFRNHQNDFTKQGEVYYGLLIDNHLVAIGGVNIDPYLQDETIGRIRHVYVKNEYRRQGYAKVILHHILDELDPVFVKLRLATNNKNAVGLYESFGFKVTESLGIHTYMEKML